MDPDVKDLIKKLMIKEPHLRLGAGIKGNLSYKHYLTNKRIKE